MLAGRNTNNFVSLNFLIFQTVYNVLLCYFLFKVLLYFSQVKKIPRPRTLSAWPSSEKLTDTVSGSIDTASAWTRDPFALVNTSMIWEHVIACWGLAFWPSRTRSNSSLKSGHLTGLSCLDTEEPPQSPSLFIWSLMLLQTNAVLRHFLQCLQIRGVSLRLQNLKKSPFASWEV